MHGVGRLQWEVTEWREVVVGYGAQKINLTEINEGGISPVSK